MGLDTVEVVAVAEPYPITPKEHGTDFLMDHRHLWLRSARQHAILRIRAGIIRAFRDYMDREGFLLMDSPIFTPNACEGTTTLFETQYFDQQAYLTRVASSIRRPPRWPSADVLLRPRVSRREEQDPPPSDRVLDDGARVGVRHARGRDGPHGAAALLHGRPHPRAARGDLTTIERDTAPLLRVQSPFPRIHYNQAVDRLRAGGQPFEWGGDFGGTDETVLSGEYDRPLFVTNYPAEVKAFYMEPDPEIRGSASRAIAWRRRATGDHRRWPAHASLEELTRRIDAQWPAAGGFRVVQGPAPLRLGAALRLRNRSGAHARLDRGARPRARDDSLPAMLYRLRP